MEGDIDRVGAGSIDAARFRQVMGHFCTGVTVVTGFADDQPLGFTVQAFASVSLEPPLLSFCPSKLSTSWPRIRPAGHFCVNILAARQEVLCRAFATPGPKKFRGVGWRPGHRTGAPVLDGGLAWVEAQVVAEHDAGDHTIVVGRVLDLDVTGDEGPLLFYRGGFGRFEP